MTTTGLTLAADAGAARPGADYVLTNVRAVLSDRVLDGATVAVEGGVITGLAEGHHPAGAIDGGGALCLPGLIDSHSDGLEKEVQPRHATRFPIDFALRSFEGKLAAWAITTIFHGVSFDERPDFGRTIAGAHAVCDELLVRRGPDVPVCHRALFRCEARAEVGFAELERRLPEFEPPAAGATRPLVSFEDHTPGQGQFRDVDAYRRSVDPAKLPPEFADVDAYVAHVLAEAERTREVRDRHRDRIEAIAATGRITLLAHDCEDPDDVAVAHERGATVAEFPLTVATAAEARRRGMAVVMGAPNALRGESHSGNVSARELVSQGLCTVLASDYQPSTMLCAAFEMVRLGLVSLPAAVALVTDGPATMCGLTDRGRLEPGRRADLCLVVPDGPWPRAAATWRSTTDGPAHSP
ncbi:MAG: alpha-D-ribose 1-methylphosphonate 5-triphosphate diphosphatase [Actinomycetota bacterium]|nr:alpha-D-ribose 1-methylphosphonate 5-triphosphate diphosphatase [Actinomycetota bacterium]